MTLRNFNAAWCRDPGTTNVKKDSVLTHMKGAPHKLAMTLEEESEFTKQPDPLPSYAVTPLGKAFFKLNQQERERERVKKLIEIAFVVAKEELPFTRFAPIAQLEKRHGVELGQTYMNDHACAEFIDSIAEVYEEELNEVPYMYMWL